MVRGTLSASAAAEACEATCTHAVMCGWEADATACQGSCVAESGLFRGTGYAAWMECYEQTACADGGMLEGCHVDAVDDAEPRGVHDQYVSECQGVANACPGVSLPSGVCDVDQVILFSDPYMTRTVLVCFDEPCDQISACLEVAVLDSF